MITLRLSPSGVHRSDHASDRTEVERGGSLNHRRSSQQGIASGTRGQPCTCAVMLGPWHSRSPDHGGVGNWSDSRMARPCGIFARRCGLGSIRCRAFRTSAPVRHQRRGARDRFGLFNPTQGTPAMGNSRARTSCSPRAWHAICESGNRAAHAQKNDLKPWRRVMWCIGELTEEYRARMYALLELYARPISKTEPVICIDEKSLQLIGHSREPLPMTPYNPG